MSIPDHRNPREKLPERRSGGVLEFQHGGIGAAFLVGWSCFPGSFVSDSWRCAEIFLNVAKSEGALEKNVRDAGILASFALQHGASLDALVAGVTHEEDGNASSIIGTALILVRDEIARLKGGDDGMPAGGGAPPPSPDGTGDAVGVEPANAEAS